jgi:formylglycine-generating enzyme required for sulfatase activity
MSDDIRIEELLDSLEPHQTPEDVCGNDKELLREVRARWERMRHVKNQLDDLFPNRENGAPTRMESSPSIHELPRIDGYDIESILGRGGMGVVFRARDRRLGRTVAIKMLLVGAYAGPTELARFQLEAEAVAGLCHTNVVQIFEVGDHEGRPYFTMEFVDGGSLAQKITASPTTAGSQPVRWAAELAPGAMAQWYINGQGQTMVAIPDPGKPFLMGSPFTEPARESYELQHKKRIARTFAIAAKPVTRGQYTKFAGIYTLPTSAYSNEDLPEVITTWPKAAAYCNWLSKEEGIDPNEWCYETRPAGEIGPNVTIVKLRANYLSLRGYRLPTEAEMEYAIRAGALTSRYFGETEELLPKYAWYSKNAQARPWPSGMLKPNDFGLFDMQGNVLTWCQDSYKEYPRDGGDDREGSLVVPSKDIRLLRGGSVAHGASSLRSAYRNPAESVTLQPYIGFRVARTLSSDPVATLPLASPKVSPNQDGIVLDKKDSLTEKDPGWIPSDAKGILKLVSGNPHKVYTLKLTKGDKLLIQLKSVDSKIDPLVALEDSKKNLIAYNDDDLANKVLDSKLVVTIPEDGEYRIIATCVHLFRKKHGDFHLTVEVAK